MAHTAHDTGVAKRIGFYSDAIEAAPGLRWLHTSGTPGLSARTGELPKDIEGQTRVAWENIIEALKKADMTINDLVKVTTSLTRASDKAAYVNPKRIPRRRPAGVHAFHRDRADHAGDAGRNRSNRGGEVAQRLSSPARNVQSAVILNPPPLLGSLYLQPVPDDRLVF
jgi:enamine deaminase RidA (YjgF/YER057c/UK114 family)